MTYKLGYAKLSTIQIPLTDLSRLFTRDKILLTGIWDKYETTSAINLWGFNTILCSLFNCISIKLNRLFLLMC